MKSLFVVLISLISLTSPAYAQNRNTSSPIPFAAPDYYIPGVGWQMMGSNTPTHDYGVAQHGFSAYEYRYNMFGQSYHNQFYPGGRIQIYRGTSVHRPYW